MFHEGGICVLLKMQKLSAFNWNSTAYFNIPRSEKEIITFFGIHNLILEKEMHFHRICCWNTKFLWVASKRDLFAVCRLKLQGGITLKIHNLKYQNLLTKIQRYEFFLFPNFRNMLNFQNFKYFLKLKLSSPCSWKMIVGILDSHTKAQMNFPKWQ